MTLVARTVDEVVREGRSSTVLVGAKAGLMTKRVREVEVVMPQAKWMKK